MMGRRWVRRLLAATGLMSLVVLFTIGPAVAADSDVIDRRQRGAFAWIDVKDSYGVSIWKYGLDLDEGGVTAVGKAVAAAFVQMIWSAYDVLVMLSLWLLDWVLSFEWLQTLATPILLLGDAMESVVDQLGLTTALLTVTAVVAVVYMARGRWATGVYEIGMSLILSALALGLLANPVEQVAGADGYLEQAHRAGLELSAALANEGEGTDKSTDQLREEQTARLADAFISDPFQVVNFGYVLDEKCERLYAEAIDEREFGKAPEARKALQVCDSQAKDYADNPSFEMVMSALVFFPAGIAVMLLSVMISASVLVAGAWAMFQSVKLIVALVLALLPGNSRGPFWSSIAETIMALVMVVFTSAFLGAFLLVISALFAAGKESGQSPVATFAIVDVMMFVGAVVFWKWRSNLKSAANRLANAMATRPGGGVNVPARQPSNLASTAMSAARTGMAIGTHRQLRGLSDQTRPSGDDSAAAGAAGPGNRPRRTVQSETGTPTSSSGVPAPMKPVETPARRRLTSGGVVAAKAVNPAPRPPRLGKAVAIAATGVATGGQSFAVRAAAKAATAAVTSTPRRAALTTKLSSASVSQAARISQTATKGVTGSPRIASAAQVTPASSKSAGSLAAKKAIVGTYRPTPMPPAHKSREYTRVVRNGRVLLVPRESER